MVERSRPSRCAVSNPPFTPPLVFTPVLCEYCPRSVVVREGQHNDTETKSCEKETPWSTSIECRFGIVAISPRSRSSVRMNNTFGFDERALELGLELVEHAASSTATSASAPQDLA